MKIFTKTTIKTLITFTLGVAITLAGGYYFVMHEDDPCDDVNVGFVTIEGDIDYPEDYFENSIIASDVIEEIEELENNEKIKGIVIELDSSGGAPTSSERMMMAVKNTSKPTVAVIRNSGTSGGYLIASAADRIFVSKLSDVGSIGISLSFLDTTAKDLKEGSVFYNFSSGKYKITGTEHSEMTKEQRDVVMEDVMQSHEIFVKYVSENRNIPIEKVEELATGRSWLGGDSVALGLADEIGGTPEAIKWLKEYLEEDVTYCSSRY